MKIYILMSEGCQCCSSTFGYYLTEQQAIKDKNQMIKDGYQNASIETAYPCDLDDWLKIQEPTLVHHTPYKKISP
jgi:hypothetical protein